MGAREIKIQQRSLMSDTYNVFVDNSKSNGLLNFTNEISLLVMIDNENKLLILDGWEINCGGDKSWEKNEESIFEIDHPGLINEIKEAINKFEEKGK